MQSCPGHSAAFNISRWYCLNCRNGVKVFWSRAVFSWTSLCGAFLQRGCNKVPRLSYAELIKDFDMSTTVPIRLTHTTFIEKKKNLVPLKTNYEPTSNLPFICVSLSLPTTHPSTARSPIVTWQYATTTLSIVLRQWAVEMVAVFSLYFMVILLFTASQSWAIIIRLK